MFITRKWLSNFINIDKFKDEEITIALNSLGFEVDSYKDYSKLNDELKIAHIGNVQKIEGTHLNFTFVDKNEELVTPIICGAGNVREGMFVILAEPGKTIFNNVTLEAKNIQGKMSEGMMCGISELGLNKSVLDDFELDGIYEVHTKEDEYTLIGNENALEVIGFNDSVWEIDLTLNRSDALAAFQIVKELANYFNLKVDNSISDFKFKELKDIKMESIIINDNAKEIVKAISMNKINVKEIIRIDDNFKYNIFSKQDIWLKFCQTTTTHNFFLDLANIIAIETGQPIVFVDPAKIKNGLEIKKNMSSKNDEILGLYDGNNIISTLGIENNLEYLPDENSKEILAIYISLDSTFMRKQQKIHNASNPAIQRYIKPISYSIHNQAYNRLNYWLNEYSILDSSTILIKELEYNNPSNIISVELAYINNLIGIKLKSSQIIKLFKTLDFKISVDKKILHFEVDPNRNDIFQKADIVEEICRLYGYNNLPSIPPTITAHSKSKNLNHKLKKNVESYLYGNAFNNTKTYSLVSEETSNKWNLFDIKHPIKLMSPLSKLRETYRLSVIPSLLEVMSSNYNKGNKNIKLFEFADVYNLKEVRETRLGLAISGDILVDNPRKIKIKNNFSYIKGYICSILDMYNLNVNNISFELLQHNMEEIHPFISSKILYNDTTIGFLFKLNPRYEQSLKLDITYVCELNISTIQLNMVDKILAKDISKFQKTSRDISFVLKDIDNFNDVLSKISKDVKFIVNTKLVDIYEDEILTENNSKSISLSFEFNDNQHQLNDIEVSKEWSTLLENVKKLNLEIR